MRLLFFTDVHGSEPALKWVERSAGAFDAVLVGGDVTHRGRLEFAGRFFNMLGRLKIPVLFVLGNADSQDLKISRNLISIHGKTWQLGPMMVGGLGGSNLTPFRTPFEIPDEEAGRILESMGRVSALVSHCPPYDTKCDTTPSEENVGSRPVRSFVEKTSPDIVLSGHVHEARGTDRIGRTIVANPGALMFGNYAIVDTSGTLRVELKNEEL